MAYYDDSAKQWYAYQEWQPGSLLVVRPIDYVDGTYLAKRPASRERDFRLALAETLVQHFSFSEVIIAEWDATRDLINALASIHKYFILLDYANTRDDDSHRATIQTEIEYAFGNHRAFYDCLHKIIRAIHKRGRPGAPEMPDSFGRMAEKEPTELARRYQLPEPLVDFYATKREVFLKLRKIRDNIIHHGHSLPHMVFKFPDGFAVSVDDKLARDLGTFNLWPEDRLKPNGLGSLLAILEFLARDILTGMTDLGPTFLRCFENPPPPLAADHQVYLRSNLARHLLNLEVYRQRHWLDPKLVFENLT